jgi:hypothetical protein
MFPGGGAGRSASVPSWEGEIETELSPLLVVGDGEARSPDVPLDPAIVSAELETRIRNGFRARGSEDD